MKLSALPTRAGDPEIHFLRAIRRRWTRLTRRTPTQISWWAEADFVRMTYQSAVLVTILIQTVDERVWGKDWFAHAFWPAEAVLAWRPPGLWIGAAFALVWLGNALLLHAWLEKRMPSPAPCRRRWIALRFLVSGTPLLGIYIFSLWRWLLGRMPSGILEPKMELLRLEGTLRPRWPLPVSRARWLQSAGPMLWLMALNHILCWIGLLWFSHPEPPVPGRRREILVLSSGVHLLLCIGIAFCLQQYLQSPAVPHPRAFLILPFLYFLPPVPYLPFLGFLLLDRVRPETGPARTLIHPVLRERRRAARLPLWLHLEDALHRRRPRDLPDDFQDSASAEHRVLRLYDLKILALGLDAGVLGWAVARLADPSAGAGGRISRSIEAITWGALGIAGLAFVVAAAHSIAVVCRLSGRIRVLDHHPYANFLLRSQLAFGLGLNLGHGLAVGRYSPKFLSTLLLLLIYLLALRLILNPFVARTRLAWRRPLEFFFLLLPLVPLGAGAAYVTRQPDPFAALARLPGWWLAASLLLNLLLSQTLLPWLLRPCRAAQIFSRDTPVRLRLRLALFALPTLLPLGGLAVPLWIHLRRRSSWISLPTP